MTTDTMGSVPVQGGLHFGSLPDEVRELITSTFSLTSDRGDKLDDEPTSHCFCDYHRPNNDSESEKSHKTWTITIQLLRLMMSILNVASDLARQRKLQECTWGSADIATDDLELAFHDGGRGGFQWLDCLVKDVDGCWIEEIVSNVAELSCPACLLGRAFESECTIRLLVIAARLAGNELDFYLGFIQQYLLDDPWWGPGYWETIEPKAVLLEGQVRELLDQCFAIRRSLKDNTGRPAVNGSQRMVRNATAGGITASPLSELSIMLAQALESGTRRGDMIKPRTREEWQNYKLAVYTWFGLLFGDLAVADPSLSQVIVGKYLSTSRLTRSLTV